MTRHHRADTLAARRAEHLAATRAAGAAVVGAWDAWMALPDTGRDDDGAIDAAADAIEALAVAVEGLRRILPLDGGTMAGDRAGWATGLAFCSSCGAAGWWTHGESPPARCGTCGGPFGA